ncbi:TPA: hypothetical protein ACG0I6_004973, partial [Escherichia coli]
LPVKHSHENAVFATLPPEYTAKRIALTGTPSLLILILMEEMLATVAYLWLDESHCIEEVIASVCEVMTFPSPSNAYR